MKCFEQSQGLDAALYKKIPLQDQSSGSHKESDKCEWDDSHDMAEEKDNDTT